MMEMHWLNVAANRLWTEGRFLPARWDDMAFVPSMVHNRRAAQPGHKIGT